MTHFATKLSWIMNGVIMDFCFLPLSHYLSQCWGKAISLYGVTRPQCGNKTTRTIPNWVIIHIAEFSIQKCPINHNPKCWSEELMTSLQQCPYQTSSFKTKLHISTAHIRGFMLSVMSDKLTSWLQGALGFSGGEMGCYDLDLGCQGHWILRPQDGTEGRVEAA